MLAAAFLYRYSFSVNFTRRAEAANLEIIVAAGWQAVTAIVVQRWA